MNKIAGDKRILQTVTITADSGFHSEANMKAIYNMGVDGYIADNQFRKRDPRFTDSATYQQEQDKRQRERGRKGPKRFTSVDFDLNLMTKTCRCPAGKRMWKSYEGIVNDRDLIRFQDYEKDCRRCPLSSQCLRKAGQQSARQVQFNLTEKPPERSYMDRMKDKIDSPMGRHLYSQRLGTVEPVFGNIETNKGLKRFTLRGKPKVNAQWLMYCKVHNIEKITTRGPLQY